VLYQPSATAAMCGLAGSCCGERYPWSVSHSVVSTTPTAETPALSDEERLERRRRFIERVLSPDGLDRDTLEHIEQLTDNES
jgi:hypothetical protein